MQAKFKKSRGENGGSGEVMKIKAEKECITQLLKVMKVLLMSTFLTNLPTPELTLALSKRISSNHPE